MISSNTLFHFTSSMNTLESIIKNGFHLRCCLEDFKVLTFENVQDEKFELAIPMVCFSNIPLSQIGNHLDNYEYYYGIGLTIDWGVTKGISPMLYCIKNQTIVETIKSLILISEKNKGKTEFKEMQILVNNLIPFIKPYEGEMLRNGKYLNTKFYDEREWRYTLKEEELKSFNIQQEQFKEEFEDKELLKQYNEILAKYPLSFEASDIDYLIVKEESEKIELVEMINSISKFGEDEKRILYTKIISKKNIEKDF